MAADSCADDKLLSDRNKAQLALIRDLFAECERRGIRIWLFGGWGIDALLGRVSREHNDIDILVEAGSRDALREVLMHILGEVGDHNMGWRCMKNGARADIFFILHCSDGTPVIDVAGGDPNVYPWPPGSFPDKLNGRLPGLSCRAISWDAQYVAKAGYSTSFPDKELRDKDHLDLETIVRRVSAVRRHELEAKWFGGIPRDEVG